jgi:modulator of FtsH protease HflC
MTFRALILSLLVVAFLAWFGSQCVFIVQQAQLALLLRFGKPVDTLSEPGLYLKYPFIDAAVYYEAHLLSLQPPVDQIILGDSKRIEVTTVSRFRIANPLRFYQSVGTDEQARANLSQIVSSVVRKHLGTVPLPKLLTQERDAISDRIRDEVAKESADLGVSVSDVRILRAELPAETSQAIYDRMTSERVREAKELRAQGFEWAQEIRSKADHDRALLLSEATRASQTRRGLADAEASSIAVAAYRQNPDFYDLYRTLQVYRTSLTQGAPTLVLSPSSELLKFFDAGPDGRRRHSDEAGVASPAPTGSQP